MKYIIYICIFFLAAFFMISSDMISASIPDSHDENTLSMNTFYNSFEEHDQFVDTSPCGVTDSYHMSSFYDNYLFTIDTNCVSNYLRAFRINNGDMTPLYAKGTRYVELGSKILGMNASLFFVYQYQWNVTQNQHRIIVMKYNTVNSSFYTLDSVDVDYEVDYISLGKHPALGWYFYPFLDNDSGGYDSAFYVYNGVDIYKYPVAQQHYNTEIKAASNYTIPNGDDRSTPIFVTDYSIYSLASLGLTYQSGQLVHGGVGAHDIECVDYHVIVANGHYVETYYIYEGGIPFNYTTCDLGSDVRSIAFQNSTVVACTRYDGIYAFDLNNTGELNEIAHLTYDDIGGVQLLSNAIYKYDYVITGCLNLAAGTSTSIFSFEQFDSDRIVTKSYENITTEYYSVVNKTSPILEVPMTYNVSGINEVRDHTTGETLSKSKKLSDVVNGTYFYDVASNTVFIGTESKTIGDYTFYSVNASRNYDLDINFPLYLEVGDYYQASGYITDPYDTLMSNFEYRVNITCDDEIVIGPTYYNCSDGLINILFSTNILPADEYIVAIDYRDMSSGVTYTDGHTFWLSTDPDPGVYVTSNVHFNFYDSNKGTGLESNLFKIYTSTNYSNFTGGRVYRDNIKSQTWSLINYKVLDYFDNQIYPPINEGTYTTVVVTSVDYFIDIPINWNTYSIKNMNHSIIRFNLTNGSRTNSVYLYPYEPYYMYLLNATYTLNITYYTDDKTVVGYLQENITIDDDDFYFVPGYDLRDVIEDIKKLENRSTIVFSFFNTNAGLGLDRETMKVYVNGSRLIGDKYYTYNESDLINVTVRDYYNNTLFIRNYYINSTVVYIDVGLTFHSYVFGNLDEKWYMLSFKKDGATYWWERPIVTNSNCEFLLPTGTYRLRIYDKHYTEIYNASEAISQSKGYIIYGENLSLVIAGLSTVNGHILTLLEDFEPDIVQVGCNLPKVYSIFDILGCSNTQNITEICPAQVLMATTYSKYWSNDTIKSFIPRNNSENGTIYTLDDILIFEGPDCDWVNITYTNNGTKIQNTSYTPNQYDLGKTQHNVTVTVNASHNITITRKTRYQQVQDFYWTKYLDENKYQATVEFNNPLNDTVWDCYYIIMFADDDTPDYSTVVVHDQTNDVDLDEGEHYDCTADGIHLMNDYIAASGSRSYKCTYYSQTENIQSSDAITKVSIPDRMTVYDNQNYYYMDAQWTNDRSDPFIGQIHIKFDFEVTPGMISPSTIDIWDEINNRYLDDDEFTYTGTSIIISQESVGTVQSGSTRIYKIYYLNVETINSVADDFFESEFAGPILWIHVIDIVIGAIAIMSVYGSKRENFKDKLWIFWLCLIALFFINMRYYL